MHATESQTHAAIPFGPISGALESNLRFDRRPSRELGTINVTTPRRAPQPAREILAYFLRNPSAADSLEGIARWRLLEEEIHRKVVETRRALEWLVREGFLIETTHPATGRLFRLNPEAQRQAELLLESQRSPKPRKAEER